MCGRFGLSTPAKVLRDYFDLAEEPSLFPRFNIAPTQPVAVVTQPAGEAHRVLTTMRWGLIPSWAKDQSIGSRMINARAESVAEKPAYRSPLKRRRCLVPADGFYEWQKHGTRKQPVFFRMRDGAPFAFAGLWDRWKSPDGEAVDSFTILTTSANEIVKPAHDRMPVILAPDNFNAWLDPALHDEHAVVPLLVPFSPDLMTAYPVSTLVNSPANDDPKCIEPFG